MFQFRNVLFLIAFKVFLKGDWINEGAIVIDAGYHPEKVGDIELSAVIEKCSAYTPVPGGVGPMTIATLIAQTVEAAEKVICAPAAV